MGGREKKANGSQSAAENPGRGITREAAEKPGREITREAESDPERDGENAGQETSVRQELLRILRRTDATRQMAEALIREATGGGKSTSVIKALEEVREITGSAFDHMPGEQIPWNELSDEELTRMIDIKNHDEI